MSADKIGKKLDPTFIFSRKKIIYCQFQGRKYEFFENSENMR